MAPSRNLTEKTENDEGKPYKRADNDGVAILLNLKLEGFMGCVEMGEKIGWGAYLREIGVTGDLTERLVFGNILIFCDYCDDDF